MNCIIGSLEVDDRIHRHYAVKSIIDFLTSETFGFLLKLLAGLATAAFGILGIGTQTRDKQGKLTRNGWIALVGIISSRTICDWNERL
jgi:hypothetical protein